VRGSGADGEGKGSLDGFGSGSFLCIGEVWEGYFSKESSGQRGLDRLFLHILQVCER
jgi:hypothetical protein